MKTDVFLSRLTKVRATGRGTWVACCPAHQDKNPSLSVRETDDGRVLVHCFAECPVSDVVAAVGMSMTDLFPDSAKDHRYQPLRKPYPAADVLECIASETAILAITASDMAKGIPIPQKDLERAQIAANRVQAGRRLANG